MRRRHAPKPEPLAFPEANGAAERAAELFGIDIEASLRAWFDDMGLTADRVEELIGRRPRGRDLGPGRPVGERDDELSLTPRQREALSYHVCGYTRTEVAEFMGVGWETVKRHTDNARFRLHAHTLAHAGLVAALLGELDSDIVQQHLLRGWE